MSVNEERAYTPGMTSRDGAPAKLNPDARSLRALAHPVRLQILDILRLEGPATATILAERLGVRTGSTSWHLQKLAEHGFIEEVPARGSRRERWWEAVKVLVMFAEALEAGPDQARATVEMMVATLRRDFGQVTAFVRQDWEFEWRHAAILNRYDQLVLDPEALEQLRSELWDLLGRYTQNPSTTPEARKVIFTMQGYPYRPEFPPQEPALDEQTSVTSQNMDRNTSG